jgi:putative copper export protein
MEVVVIVHLLAACVWVGGSVALIVAGVPAIRILEGEPRQRAMREIGLRWRPLGYGALAVLAITGVPLAQHDYDHCAPPFRAVLWIKIGLTVGLVAASYTHNFVLGPRLQRQIREGLPQTARPTLVWVGYLSLALTLTVPILGAVLAHLA